LAHELPFPFKPEFRWFANDVTQSRASLQAEEVREGEEEEKEREGEKRN
jgi:hypothetical protein